jgi:FkbM family methyltransferase
MLAELEGLFDLLVEARSLHGAHGAFHRFMGDLCRRAFRASDLRRPESTPVPFGPFGEIVLPYHAMGAIDSIDLFGLDELIIFAFYWANRTRYRRAADVGANLGLHAILMQRCGFAVTAFEPDPVHFDLLTRNLALNGARDVRAVMAAVSDADGTMEFVRVKGNTPGSHLAGAKADPYGELDRFPVEVRNVAAALDGAELVKIDAEGHEARILRALPAERWAGLDAMIEVGSGENARLLFEHFAALPVRLFAQKIGWGRVTRLADMPTGHSDGSLFITARADMPWGSG